jgi:hypothetical protein
MNKFQLYTATHLNRLLLIRSIAMSDFILVTVMIVSLVGVNIPFLI